MSVNIGSSKVGIYLGERPLSGDSDWELLWQYEGTTGTGWSKTEILSADLSKYKGLYLKVSAQGTSTNTNKQGAIYISLEDMRANGNTQMGIQFGIIAGNNWGYRSFAFREHIFILWKWGRFIFIKI